MSHDLTKYAVSKSIGSRGDPISHFDKTYCTKVLFCSGRSDFYRRTSYRLHRSVVGLEHGGWRLTVYRIDESDCLALSFHDNSLN
jgi:hypothetical protein